MISKIAIAYVFLILVASPVLFRLFGLDAVFLNSIELKELGTNVPFYIGLFLLFFLLTIYITKSKYIFGNKLLVVNKSLPRVISNYKVYIMYPIVVLALLYFMVNNFTMDLSMFNENRSLGNKGSGPILYFVSVIVPGIIGFKMLSDKKMGYLLVLFFLLGASTSMLVGFRGPFLSNIFFLLLIRYKIRGKWWFKSDLIYLSVLLLLIGVYGGLRNSNFEAGSFDLLAIMQATILRISSFELIGIMDTYVSKHGYDFFLHNLRDDIWIMIPRALVESKPISLSEVIANNVYSTYLNSIGIFQDDYGGVSYTAVGEGLYNFGSFGVVLYAIVLGLLFSLSDRFINSDSWVLFLIGRGIFVNLLGLIEAPQLGVNALIMNVITSLILLKILKK